MGVLTEEVDESRNGENGTAAPQGPQHDTDGNARSYGQREHGVQIEQRLGPASSSASSSDRSDVRPMLARMIST